MKTIIHINNATILTNKKQDLNEPPITVQFEDGDTMAHIVYLYGLDGKEVGRVIYNKDNPLNGTYRCWLEMDTPVVAHITLEAHGERKP